MFKIRFWPAVLVAFVVTVTTLLGFWQRSRAHEKEALQHAIEQFEHAPATQLGATRIELAAINYHRVLARGRFMPQDIVYLQNRSYKDQPGFYALMPFQIDGGGYVLVNRGWLPRRTNDMSVAGPVRTPDGDLEITGVARADPGRAFELGKGGSAPHLLIRQNLDVNAYAHETGLPLQPFVLMQTSDDGDGLVRDWPAPTTGVQTNYGYMMQWWGMAVAALVFGLYAARKAARREDDGGPAATQSASPLGDERRHRS